MSLKLITLNIEGDSHISTVSEFLKAQNADIVCFQEIFESDLDYFKELLQTDFVVFAPLMKVLTEPNMAGLSPKGNWGIAIFSQGKPLISEYQYYAGTRATVPVFDNQPNTNNRAIVSVKIQKDDSIFTIITTHFTWASAADPAVSKLQIDHLAEMKKLLSGYEDYVLCGDFNAPRGREVYEKISENLVDHMPENVETTIDPNLHRVKNLTLVVDSIFSTPEYTVKEINIFDGISDHKAIVAKIEKVDS